MTPKQAQWQLLFLDYYDGAIDGIWGKKSKAATLAFQKDFFEDSIAHDGKFGASTAAKSQEVVDRIQEILQTIVPGLKDDGLAGQKTVAALKTYQESKGLAQTGRVDDATWDVLMLEIPRQEQPTEPVPEVDSKEVVVSKNETTTGTFWDEIEYFTRDEFKCKCGGKYCNGYPSEPDERMVRIANQLRKNLGVPVTIVSGLRCKTWNAIQGGVSNSQHMYGEAADIYVKGVSQSSVEAELDKIGGVRYHYPIKSSSNVHFDVPKGNR
jgi:uncharacterized protein YcbK (DUF882 family)